MSGIVKPTGTVFPDFGPVEPVNFRADYADYFPPKPKFTIEKIEIGDGASGVIAGGIYRAVLHREVINYLSPFAKAFVLEQVKIILRRDKKRAAKRKNAARSRCGYKRRFK